MADNEIRAIRWTDGDTYVNADDLSKVLKTVALRTNCATLSALRLVEIIKQHLQGGANEKS